jgi:hypothetical protein
VHTLSLNVSKSLNDINANVDQEAVLSLISKMGTINDRAMDKNDCLVLAADRASSSSIQEVRDAMVHVACDVVQESLSARTYSLMVPYASRLIPLYMLALNKSVSSVDCRTSSSHMCSDRLSIEYGYFNR